MIESFILAAEVGFKFCRTEVHGGKTHIKDRYYEFESFLSRVRKADSYSIPKCGDCKLDVANIYMSYEFR